MKLLLPYWWPGNIRELENLIERLVAVGDKEWITDEDLPLDYHSRGSTRRRPPEREPVPGGATRLERNFIIRALERNDWNVSATARFLGIPLSISNTKMAVARYPRAGA